MSKYIWFTKLKHLIFWNGGSTCQVRSECAGEKYGATGHNANQMLILVSGNSHGLYNYYDSFGQKTTKQGLRVPSFWSLCMWIWWIPYGVRTQIKLEAELMHVPMELKPLCGSVIKSPFPSNIASQSERGLLQYNPLPKTQPNSNTKTTDIDWCFS
jgi:hypothetical protein